MRFIKTTLDGIFVIELEEFRDERGFFARAFCQQEFEAHDLNPRVVQSNVSFNKQSGTLRGMHYQVGPHEETKLVRCTRGAIFDVVIDLRPDSPTRLQWFGAELTAQNRKMLYIAENCAHGFLTLQPESEVTYHVGESYAPEQERGVRFDDPAFAIQWPGEVRVISAKDANWPDYRAAS